MTEQQAPYSAVRASLTDAISRMTTTAGGEVTFVPPAEHTHDELIAYFKLQRHILIEQVRWIERRYPETVS